MANKKDYSEIKKRRNYLPNFMVNWNRLPEYLAETNQEVQSLQILSTVVGELASTTDLTQGDSLIVGKQYIVYLEAGDDFSNVGYTLDGEEFTAIAPTPNIWLNNSNVQISKPFTIYYNDIDPNIYIEASGGVNYNIKVTNNAFTENKTFPNIVSGSAINVVDTNTIYYNAQNNPKYFKIEVYV